MTTDAVPPTDARNAVAIDRLQTAGFSYQRWRDNFLDLILRVACLIGLPAVIVNTIDVIRTGAIVLAIVYIAAYVAVVAVVIRRSPGWLRVGVLLGVLYGLGLSGLMENGMRGDARLFFLTCTILAAFLINLRAGILSLALSQLTIFVVAGLVFSGQYTLTSRAVVAGDVSLWVVGSISFLLAAGMLLAGLQMFFLEFERAQGRVGKVLADLGQERTLLRTVIDNLPDAVFAEDRKERKTIINRAELQLIGVEDEKEVLGKTGQNLLSDEKARRASVENKRVMETGQAVVDREVAITDAAGRERVLLSSKLPLFDPEGKIVGLVGIGRDITERKHAEETIQRQIAFDELVTRLLARFASAAGSEIDAAIQDGLRDLAQHVGVERAFVIRLNDDRQTWSLIHDWSASPMMTRWELNQNVPLGRFGWFADKLSRNDVLKINRLEDYPPEASAERAMNINQGVQALLLVPSRGVAGSVIGCIGLYSYARPMNWSESDAGSLRIVGDAIANVLERKQAELELRHTKNYLDNILNSMPSILVGVDVDGRVTHWNAQACQITNLNSEQAQGQPLERVLPQFGTFLDELRAAIRDRQPRTLEKVETRQGGERRYADVLVFPLVVNAVTGAVIRVDDVTERVRLEELMIQAEKMLSVGGLAAGMAHEINNPLGAILQSAQNIERRLSIDLPANVAVAQELGLPIELMRRYLDQRGILNFLTGIRESGERAARIVSNMLQFSRRSESQFQPMPLTELLDRAVELAANDYDLKKKYDFRHIGIVRDYDPGLPAVPVIVTEIEQVFLNLLKNSAHAMFHRTSTSAPQITLRTRRDNDWAVVEVADNGSGMEESVRKRVFEPFFTTKEVGVGTGLGLSVSYMIVTSNHKGTIGVESALDQGTTFTIRLPLQR